MLDLDNFPFEFTCPVDVQSMYPAILLYPNIVFRKRIQNNIKYEYVRMFGMQK